MKPHTAILTNVPPETQLVLYLIREELKSRRMFQALHEIGLDDCFYQADFSTLILDSVGLGDESNETSDFYFSVMEKHSQKVEPDERAITQRSLMAYTELMIEKERRNKVG